LVDKGKWKRRLVKIPQERVVKKVLRRRRPPLNVTEEDNGRHGRCKHRNLIQFNYHFFTVFSLFTIVRFANEPCEGTSGDNGTCYTK